jgi:NADPH-dependent curcumin reductase CurA
MTEPRNSINRRVILKSRPVGVPQASHFGLEDAPIAELCEGEFLVANRFLSVDPAMRGWVNDVPNYSPPVPVGDVMRVFAAGEVIASRHSAWKVGDLVTGMLGWQRFPVSDGLTSRERSTRAICRFRRTWRVGAQRCHGVFRSPHAGANSAIMQGFLVFDFQARYGEAVSQLVQ